MIAAKRTAGIEGDKILASIVAACREVSHGFAPLSPTLGRAPVCRKIERGYTGKRVTVFSFVTRLRKALGIPAQCRTIRDGTVALPEARPLTPRCAIWLVLQRPEQRDPATVERITRFRAAHSELDAAITLTEGFATLIRTRDPAARDCWLDQAVASVLAPFRSFATSLRRDDSAVRAGVELEWSTGPVEGAINRLTMIKRTMYGRAGFPLLQRRVLLAS